MAGKKISKDQLAGNTEVFSDLISPSTSNKATVTQNTVIEEKQEKDVHLTMLVKESTRKQWKQFFIDHDLNTTQGIEIAMLHLMDDVLNNKYRLNKGGLVEVQQPE